MPWHLPVFSRAGCPQAQARPHCQSLWGALVKPPAADRAPADIVHCTSTTNISHHHNYFHSAPKFYIFFRIPGWGLLTSHHSLSHHMQCMNKVALPGGITPRKQTRPLPTPGGDVRLKLAQFAFEQLLGMEAKTQSDGTCDWQHCSNVTVSRSTHTSPASSLPCFYTRLFGIVSSHHKHAFCSQT